MTFRARVVAASVLSALVLVAAWADESDGRPVIYEDEPGWNCEVHGNRICGPVSAVVDVNGNVTVYDGEWRSVAVVAPERVAFEDTHDG